MRHAVYRQCFLYNFFCYIFVIYSCNWNYGFELNSSCCVYFSYHNLCLFQFMNKPKTLQFWKHFVGLLKTRYRLISRHFTGHCSVYTCGLIPMIKTVFEPMVVGFHILNLAFSFVSNTFYFIKLIRHRFHDVNIVLSHSSGFFGAIWFIDIPHFITVSASCILFIPELCTYKPVNEKLIKINFIQQSPWCIYLLIHL